jgi:hypothetical protein
MQDIVLTLVRNPPLWIVTILVVLLVSHTIKHALHLPAGGLIPILEFFVTVLLGILVLHDLLERHLVEQNQQTIGLGMLLAVLIGFVFLSAVLYIIDRKI